MRQTLFALLLATAGVGPGVRAAELEEEVEKRTVTLIQDAGKAKAAPGSPAAMVVVEAILKEIEELRKAEPPAHGEVPVR